MHFTEQLRVPVPVSKAWDFLWQTERLAACLPGCVSATEVEPGKTYKARFEDHVGPYKVAFELDVAIEEARPQERIRMLATGQDRKLGVSQRVALQVDLKESGVDETTLDVEADVEVLGKIATLGQFVVKRKAREVVKQFSENIEKELRGAGGDHA